MVVLAYRIKLKNVLRFYQYVKTADTVVKLMKSSNGNVFAGNTSTGFQEHFIKSVWRSTQDIENFRQLPEFQEFYKILNKVSSELEMLEWEVEEVPTWSTVFRHFDERKITFD